MRIRLYASILFLSLFFMFIPRAQATKYLATRYGMDCTSCHNGVLGQLTPMGQDVRWRGRIAGETKTQNWQEMVSVNTKLRFHDGSAPGRNSTFEFHALAMYFGGVLSDHLSFDGEIYLFEHTGKNTSPVNSDFGRSKLAEAYLKYVSNKDKSAYWSAKFGQIAPDQLVMYWGVGPRQGETRPYIVNNSAVSPNNYKPFMRNFGVELARHQGNWHIAAGLLNGTGASTTNSVDNNRAKDMYATIDYAIGGEGSAVGVYGYRGRGLVMPSAGGNWENSFFRVGAFGRYTHGRFSLTGAATEGQEQIASGIKPPRTRNLGLLTQADYNLSNKWAAFSRYDYFDPNTAKSSDHLYGPVFGLVYRLTETGRATFECHKQGKYDGKPMPWEARIEVVYMF